MKINFDEIFNNREYEPTKYVSKDSQISTTRGYDSLFTSKARQLSPVTTKVDKQTQFQKRAKIMNTIKTNKQQEKKNYKYYKPSRLDEELVKDSKNNNKKSKASDKIDKHKIKMITERLYKPIQCKKSKCKDLELQQFYKIVEQQHLYEPKHIINHERSLTETCQRLKEPSLLHQRLYWEYKSKEFRGMQLQNEYQEMKQPNSVSMSSGNKSYLKNYIKFYDRLDHEVSRKVKKQNYYDHNPNLNTINTKNQGQAFQPNIAVSMRSLNMIGARPKITPRAQVHAIKGQGEMNKKIMDDINASLNNSVESLNKTQQIIRSKQNKIKHRFCEIFDNDGKFEVTSEAIQNLEQEQFEILFPLLQQIEENSNLTVSDFEDIFQQYYQELPITEKQKLRQQQKQKKDHLSFISSSHKNQNKQKKLITQIFNKDYLRKIQNFV